MEIGVLISAVSILITLVTAVIRQSITLGRSLEKLDTLKQTVKDFQDKAEKDFAVLYKFKSESETALASISVTLKNINSTMQEIKSDVKELKAK